MSRKPSNGPMVSCKICGKQLKQITPRHLDTHSITLDEYRDRYEKVNVPVSLNGQQVERGEVFDSLASWIASDSQLTPIATKVVDSLLMDEGRRFEVVMRAVASAKLARMKDMLMALDRVEGRLYDPNNIATMSNNELLQLKRMLDSDATGFTDLLISLTGKAAQPQQVSLTQIVDQRTQILQTDDLPLPATPQERERLAQAYHKLMAEAREPEVLEAEVV